MHHPVSHFFLVKVRLSWYFFSFFAFYMFITGTIQGVTFEPGALTLFSINSFLYGFYIAPVLSTQRTRIDELNKIIRAEANALFDMLLKTKKLPEATRNKLQDLFEDYMRASLRQRRVAEGEPQYEALITYCLKYKGDGKEVVEKILNGLVENQKNRSNLAMQLGGKVYPNEWWIMLVLFSVTLGFVLFLNIGSLWIMTIVRALLCTGLTMLMINLLKLSTLTHKRAKSVWDPLDKLLDTRFYRID